MREDQDINQEEIARYLGVTQTAYSNYEIGKREMTPDALGRLADYYRTSVDYLMGRTDEKKPYPKPKYPSQN